MTLNLEALAQQLEASGAYRVLRKVAPPVMLDVAEHLDRRVALLLDCETTGLDPATDEVIELAMVAFEYGDAGPERVLRTFSALHKPSRTLTPDVERITGLSSGDLQGQQINDAAVDAFLAGTAFVIAHNAGFDRPFVERRWPAFERLNWGCSLSQVPWRDRGFEAVGLKALLAEAGLFHDGHRALEDCVATLKLIGLPILAGGRTPFAAILERSRVPGAMVWALSAPFAAKDALKARGYRWSDGTADLPRAWHIEVLRSDLETETAFLEREVYRGPSTSIVVPVTARDRFSTRAGRPRLTTDRTEPGYV